MATALLLSGYAPRPLAKAVMRRAPARRRGRPLANLAGSVLGELQVIAPAPRVDGRTRWFCLCACGRPAIVRTSHLTTGQILSCGCRDGRRRVPWWVLQ